MARSMVSNRFSCIQSVGAGRTMPDPCIASAQRPEPSAEYITQIFV